MFANQRNLLIERYPQENSGVDPPMNNWDHRDYHPHQHGHDYHHYNSPHCHDQVFCHLPLAVKNERLECPLPIRMLALLRANPIWPFHRPAPALVSSDFIAPPPHTHPPPRPLIHGLKNARSLGKRLVPAEEDGYRPARMKYLVKNGKNYFRVVGDVWEWARSGR